MRKAVYIIGMIATLFAACTAEFENEAMSQDVLTLTVGDFPVFEEAPSTRTVGMADAGKTAWVNGDRLLVSVEYEGGTVRTATMTYDGSVWKTEPVLRRVSNSYTLTAYYAPAYEWGTDNTLAGMSGKTAGTDEFLMVQAGNSTIDFSAASRAYSRLRFASATNTQLTVTLTDFTPAGYNTSVVDNYTATLTTDSKGNAYLYGSWNANAKLTVSANYLTSKIEKTLSASTPAQSYALDTPQLISSIPSNWNNSTTDITGYYKLNANITLSGNWTPIGNATTNRVQGRFIGTFDGDGHTITGLTSNSGGDFGLFRTIGEGGVVKNMNISCNISGNGGFKGGIAANNYGTIENCHVSGTISGSNRIGGIAGYNTYTTTSGAQIIACSNTASINGSDDVGGICGDNNKSTVLACYNTGEIKKDSEDGGAICGYNRGTVTSCYYTQGTGVGTQVTEWNDAIDDMNSALQAAGYSYQYELDTSSGLPVVKTED